MVHRKPQRVAPTANGDEQLELDGAPAPAVGAAPGPETEPGVANGAPTLVAARPAAPAIAPAPPAWRFTLTLESGLWLVLIAAAILTRFWDLSYRALHHDETIHSYYSWGFYFGTIPYVHNPLSHGPFLFHANALVYLLFGASDATTRYAPALAGVLLVGLPWLLRGPKLLGRWGALAAGLMLLISPSFLYYTRYIRHDPFTAVGALVVFICIFRYIERPQRRWLVLGFIAMAFLFTNHEIIFAIAAVMFGIIWVRLLWGALRPLVPVHLLFAGLGVLVLVARRVAHWPQLPAIPWQNPTPQATRDYYHALLTNPFVVSVIVLFLAFVATCAWVLNTNKRGKAPGGWFERTFGDAEPGTLEAAVYAAGHDGVGIAAGIASFLLIFVGLFTTLFTNFDGLATGTFAPNGTLLYWLGQQGVRRGEQPWFYFLILAPQYEWLAIAFGVTGGLFTAWRISKAARGDTTNPRLFLQAFLAIWFAFLFLSLSYAGEKMPWLILHFTLPAILLGACYIDEIVARGRAWFAASRQTRFYPGHEKTIAGTLVGGLVMLAGTWFLLAARLTNPVYAQGANGQLQRQIPAAQMHDWWLMALPPIAAIALVLAVFWILGPRRTAYATVTAAFIVMSLFELHAGFRLAFLQGDVALDTLIYNTTSPDVPQLVHDVGQMSELTTGTKDLSVYYDGCTEWPLVWYLRDFGGRRKYTSYAQIQADKPAVVVAVPQQWDDPAAPCNSGTPLDMDGYTAQTLVLRWHEPEFSIYRNFAIAPEILPGWSAMKTANQPHSIVNIAGSVASSMATLFTPAGQQRAYRLLMYRQLPDGLNDYKFRVYIRNDMLPLYNQVRYGT